MAVLEVAQAAVDQLGGLARGLAGEVAPFAQGHRQAAQGRVPGDGRAGRAAADHQDVEDVLGEPGQRRPTGNAGSASTYSLRAM